MVPRVGQRIGPYEILGRLGSGGMGLVYSAWDARLQRDVAIKILREEYATPSMRTRFLQEARAASGLSHPNICTVFDIGEIAGDPYLVMELLKGETLRARISHRGEMPPEDLYRVAGEVLDALAMAHSHGIIHRDIKPANIILVGKPDRSFQSKVLDFGLAKVDAGEKEVVRHDLTTLGTTVGTVSYMSPEQARGESLDARSDLFSLGSVLYEAATGELPFQGSTSALIFVELLGKAPMPIRDHNPAIPRDLDRFIGKLLSKAPADRYQSAEEAAKALKSVSLRRSRLESLLTRSTTKQRTDAPRANRPLKEEPSTGRPSEPPISKGPSSETVLRPLRRGAEPGNPRTPPPDGPPSPSALPLRSSNSPAPEPYPIPLTRSSPMTGSLVVRPVKPDPLRSLRMRETPVPTDQGSKGHVSSSEVPTVELDSLSGSSRAVLGEEDFSSDSSDPLQEALAESVPAHEFSSSGRAKSSSDDSSPHRDVPIAQNDKSLGGKKRQPRVWVAVLACFIVAIAIMWVLVSRRQATAFKAPVTLLMARGNNNTNDASLPGVIATGLQFAAAQSPHLLIRSAQDYELALRTQALTPTASISMDQARSAARTTGAGVLAFIDLRKTGATYELTLRLVDASNERKIGTNTETVSSREQLAGAIDRLGADLRTALGENSSDHNFASLLGKEATSNLDALQAYAGGAELELAGNTADAIPAYQRALSLDPHFTQAYLRLASLYRSRHAEMASAAAATQAQSSSRSASPRLQALAQAAYAIYAAGDYPGAVAVLNDLLQSHPNDLDAYDQLALALYLEGKYAETQAAVERALQLFPYDASAIQLQEMTLIAQGRPEAVGGVEERVRVARLSHPGLAAMAGAGGAAPNDTLIPSSDTELPTAVAASLLDSAGHFTEGASRWQVMGGYARSMPEQLSSAAYAESTAGLHRSMAGECAAGLVAAHVAQSLPSGPVATFNSAEAMALCGELEPARQGLDTLNGAYGRNFAVRAYLAPDLAATIAWKSGDTTGALHLLDGARQFDHLSMTGYLRGLVELSSGQPQVSITQFQGVLSRRGPAILFAPEIYPLAQLGLARAYAAGGDLANSSVAYGRFLELWSSADPGLSAVNEAHRHAHL